MIATMSDAPLTGTVALLSDAPLEELIGVVEVLAQEGVANLSLPVDSASLEELVALYGQRIRIGVHGAVKARISQPSRRRSRSPVTPPP